MMRRCVTHRAIGKPWSIGTLMGTILLPGYSRIASSALRSASSHSEACSDCAACLNVAGTTNCRGPSSVFTSITFCEALKA